MRRKKRKNKQLRSPSAGKIKQSASSREEPSLMAQAIQTAYRALGKSPPAGSEASNQNPARSEVSSSSEKAPASLGTAERQLGTATQVSPDSLDVVDLVIGFDMGTSCTKIVIQDIAQRTAYAVPFNGLGSPAHPYLLPTIVHLDDSGEFSLQKRGKAFRGLKQNLMAVAAKSVHEREGHRKSLLPHTIAYLALALRAARQWFFDTHGNSYRGRKIAWQINVGLPASRFDEPDLRMLYRSAMWRSWHLSTVDDPVTMSLARQYHLQPGLQPDDVGLVLEPGLVEAFPEVVSAVQGYAKSPERKEGLHLLVDVGASTLDVTCFRLFEYDDEDTYPIFCATVSRLGGFELFEHRAGTVTTDISKYIDSLRLKMDGISEVQNALKIEYLLTGEEQQQIDDEFSNWVGEAIWAVVSETKVRRDPNAQEWKASLPTFICGGASRLDVFTKALARIDRNRNWTGQLNIKELSLPRVVEAPGLSVGYKHRLLVAYGLSFNALDIGKLIPPSGIPDPSDDGPHPDIRDTFVGPEMV